MLETKGIRNNWWYFKQLEKPPITSKKEKKTRENHQVETYDGHQELLALKKKIEGQESVFPLCESEMKVF